MNRGQANSYAFESWWIVTRGQFLRCNILRTCVTEIKVVKRSSVSTGQLRLLPTLHSQPINLVVFQGTQSKSDLGTGFALRCFQRLSEPFIATLRCLERDNRNTSGTSLQILSY
jgi:hypothetical protein